MSGIRIVDVNTFVDHRGKFVELFRKDWFSELKFIEDDVSISYKDVLRGFHGDREAYKLFCCTRGSILLTIISTIDNFNVMQIALDEENLRQVLIPPMFITAYFALSDLVHLNYKQTRYYDINRQIFYPWDWWGSDLWPIANPILSERDRQREPIP